MTDTALRRENRRRQERMDARRRITELAMGLIMIVMLLAAFALAGTLDYQDRTEGLGASMVPEAGWAQLDWGE